MIYLSDDYLNKYIDVFGYLFSRSIKEKYSLRYIERIISHSLMVDELESSNISTIAFSSQEKIYHDMFPLYGNEDFVYNPYDLYGWLGFIYVHLFLKYQTTFETLFIVLPLDKAIESYHLYHEMDITQTYELFASLVKYSYLDNIMKYKNISTAELSERSGIPYSTITAIRYNKRDISKLESAKLYKIARCLNVKITSLLNCIELEMQQF